MIFKQIYSSTSCVNLVFLLFLYREVQKRAQGKKRIGKKNFKKRWLRVTNKELSYHKHKGETSIGFQLLEPRISSSVVWRQHNMHDKSKTSFEEVAYMY